MQPLQQLGSAQHHVHTLNLVSWGQHLSHPASCHCLLLSSPSFPSSILFSDLNLYFQHLSVFVCTCIRPCVQPFIHQLLTNPLVCPSLSLKLLTHFLLTLPKVFTVTLTVTAFILYVPLHLKPAPRILIPYPGLSFVTFISC